MAVKRISIWAECEKNAYAQFPEETFDFGATVNVPGGYECVIWRSAYDNIFLAPGEHALNKYLNGEKKLFGGGKLMGKIGFVNKTLTYNVDWGTGQPVVYFDKALAKSNKVGFSGSMEVKVDIAEEFIKYIRDKNQPNVSLKEVVNELGPEFIKGLAPSLKACIDDNELDFAHIPAMLSKIAYSSEIRLRPIFSKKGLWIQNFVITGHTFLQNDD